MPKKRERNSDEWYKSQIRELAKENKHLRKRVRELEKREHFYGAQDMEAPGDDEDTMPTLISTTKICPHCGKGKLSEFDIIGRVYETCNICDYRNKIRG